MSRNFFHYVVFIFFTFFLFGCISRIEQKILPIRNSHPENDGILQMRGNWIQHQGESCQSEKHIHHYNWIDTIQPMIEKMLKKSEITASSLLVENVNNWTNGSLDTEEITAVLRNMLIDNNNFNLISSNQLSAVKKKFGLSLNDSFASCSKAIGIARNIGAQYLLYSGVTGNVHSPSLQIMLILVQTGEIIWSEKSNVIHL